jgi:hypothetical protein
VLALHAKELSKLQRIIKLAEKLIAENQSQSAVVQRYTTGMASVRNERTESAFDGLEKTL